MGRLGPRLIHLPQLATRLGLARRVLLQQPFNVGVAVVRVVLVSMEEEHLSHRTPAAVVVVLM
jgi:hypothetical protein